MNLLKRPRRNRRSEGIRSLVEETHLLPQHLIWPLFVCERGETEISSMPGCYRRSIDATLRAIEPALKKGLRAVALFPCVEESLKNPTATEALNPEGLGLRCLRALKQTFPDLVVFSDVALDPFSSDGHDGLVKNGKILNDETLGLLAQMAVLQAKAGADYVSPSDMMDGRVGFIRRHLDECGFRDTGIMAYSAKYASSFYGPFRDALDSSPRFGDKKTYQMNPKNIREALLEVKLDEEEGADIILIKPGLPYLDVIREARRQTQLPVAAYQVSGEYAMLKAAAQNRWLDEKRAVLETLHAFRRAGADMILSYFAPQVLDWMLEPTTRLS